MLSVSVFASVFGESFGELASKLTIYEDSLQMSLDSVIVADYSAEAENYFTDMLTGCDWTKRYVAVRVLSKIEDKKNLAELLAEKRVDPAYSFRIFENDSNDFFTDYPKPLKEHQLVPFARIASKRGWEGDFDEIRRIAESKENADYVAVQILDCISFMAEKNPGLLLKLDARFFTGLFKRENQAVNDKVVMLLSKMPDSSAEIVLDPKNSIEERILLVRLFASKLDFGKVKEADSFYEGILPNQRLMLDFEIGKYLSLFPESLLSAAADGDSLANVRKIATDIKGELNGE